MIERLRRRRFERLVGAHSADLYRFGYWLCRDRFIAEELVQETFGRAWEAFQELREPRAAKAWLFTILRRENARRFERQRPELRLLDAADVDVNCAVGFLHGAEDLLTVREAVARLPEALAEPLLLQVLGGFSCGEIAVMLEATEGAITTRVCRARALLREELEGPRSESRREGAS